MSRKKNKKITDSARGEDCQVRLEGICNFNPETTIPAHLNGGGMGYKHNDMFIAYACSACHAVIDGAVQALYDKDELKLAHYEGMVRTQYILLEKGLIKA
jgi:hypothetical protein